MKTYIAALAPIMNLSLLSWISFSIAWSMPLWFWTMLAPFSPAGKALYSFFFIICLANTTIAMCIVTFFRQQNNGFTPGLLTLCTSFMTVLGYKAFISARNYPIIPKMSNDWDMYMLASCFTSGGVGIVFLLDSLFGDKSKEGDGSKKKKGKKGKKSKK
ncbi:hypothetical protein Ciccas_003070 [Cichlidogyrus casuarinus]|uniref:NADH dehydrogenase subunit 6 n=1 Tax=Cichlidogyrus casuarinus TaxID=1844966 RepID=A0ABD2QFJ0_9PLAT